MILFFYFFKFKCTSNLGTTHNVKLAKGEFIKRIITIVISLIILGMLWYLGDLSQQTKVKEGATTMGGISIFNKNNVYLVEDLNFTREDANNLLIDEIIGKYKSVSKLNINIGSNIKEIKNCGFIEETKNITVIMAP